jgi:hypothetical protein
VKHRIVVFMASLVLLMNLFVAAKVAAQTIAYRQTNLASNLPNVANEITPQLVNPWGITFLSGQPFFIADNQVGRVTVHGSTGAGVGPSGFIVPNVAGTGFDTPTGIIADQNSFFGGPSLIRPFILVTDQGTVFTWGPDARGDLPSAATLQVNNHSSAAVIRASQS